MNGNDGLLITGSGTATDLAFAGIVLRMNKGDGLGIDSGTVRRLSLQGDVISTNSGDGLRVLHATLSDISVQSMSEISENGGHGVHVIGSAIAPESAVTGSFGFIIDSSTLVNNGFDGIRIEADTSSATTLRASIEDLTIDHVAIASNDEDGIHIEQSDISDFTIQNAHVGQAPNGSSIFIGNQRDGFRAENSTLTGLAFLDSFFNGNGADGIGILVSVIDSGPVTLHDPSMRITTGFTLRNLQSIGNDNGIDFNGDTASDVTIKNAVIAENRSDGIVIVTTDNVPSSFTDLVIQDSAVGAAPNPLGGVFIGNGADGFHAEVTTFTGVAFLDSSFNGNGVRLNGADGIVFGTSTISTGPITLDGGTQIAGAGFTFENSQAVRNTGNGVQFNTVTASDISFKSDIIADNELDGILIQDKDPGEGAISSIGAFSIEDSYLGAAPNPLGGTFAGNRGNGFAARDTSFTGVGFVESFFNGNGTSQNGGDGILFFHSRINAEPMAAPSTVPASLKPGFRLSGSQVIGNKADGAEFDAVTATGLIIDNSITADNAVRGVFVYDTDLRDTIVSNITDFVIQNSYLGAAPDPMGGMFLGNGTGGFEGEDSTFTGVAFLNSFFNGNNRNVAGAGGGGIDFTTSTIHSGQVGLPDSDMTLTTGFTLKDSQSIGAGVGVSFGVDTADNITIDGSILAQNGEGILVGFGSNIGEFVIQNSHIGEVRDANGNLVFTGNTAYGIFAGESTFRRVAFLNSDFNANDLDGIFFRNSRINSGAMSHAGFTLTNSQVVGNDVNGVDFDGVTATHVIFKGDTIAENRLDGVFVNDSNTTDGFASSFADFVIQDSHLGAGPNPNGGAFTGNSESGFDGQNTIFTGVAFLDSFFNGNGTVFGNSGIRYFAGAIKSGLVTLDDPDSALTTGFTLQGSQLIGNAGDALGFGSIDVKDVTIKSTDIAGNGGNGISTTASTITGLLIQDSHLGEVRDSTTGQLAVVGNELSGFFEFASTFIGLSFLNSTLNGNGIDGLRFLEGSIQPALTNSPVPNTMSTGLTFKGSQISGNVGNGVEITDSTIDDVSFDGGTQISDNGGACILIAATGLDGTNGSILFGDAAITGNMTGIMVENDDATAPLLLTFETTRIGGGVDGLVLSGSGIGLTGGGGTIPGGSTVGGGNTAGDGLFGGSLGALAFSDQTGDFIRLENGALFAPGTPTVIDASNVIFNGALATSLTAKQRNQIEHKVVEFNDVNTLGLIFLPQAVQTVQMLPSPAEVRDVIKGLPRKENTPGDTLFLNTEGLKLSTNSGQPNAFCFRYSMADPTGHEDEKKTCLELSAPPTRVTPNGYLHDFWRGWQASRL